MLLRYLLNFWLGPMFGLFFAAGAVADAGAAGGGDASASGDAGGGDAGSSSGDAISTPGDTTPTGDDTGAPEEGSTDTQPSPDTLVDSGDGRKIPQKYAELFKTDKALKQDYFNQRALERTYPGGVKEAIALAKQVEDFGGVEGVQQLQSEIATHNADAELFEKDPAKWAEQGFQENPESAIKATLRGLEYIAENHAEQYAHVGSKLIIQDLNSACPVHEIHALLAGLKDNPQAQQLAKKLAEYYNDRFEKSQKVPARQIDPQQKKLDEQRADLSKKEQEIRNKSINSEAAPYMTRAIESSLDKIAKSSGFDLAKLKKESPNRYGRFLKDVRAALHQNVLSDSKWLERYSAALSSNDAAKCVRMLNARHDQAINGNGREPGVVAPLFAEWFGPPKAGAKPGDDHGKPRPVTQGGGNGSGKAPLHVNAMPPKNEINWQHPQTKIIDQVAMRKDGKLVSWAQ